MKQKMIRIGYLLLGICLLIPGLSVAQHTDSSVSEAGAAGTPASAEETLPRYGRQAPGAASRDVDRTSLRSRRELVNRHELRFGLGYFPLSGDDRSFGFRDNDDDFFFGTPPEEFERAGLSRSVEFSTGALTLMYTYRVGRMFEAGGALSYVGYFRNLVQWKGGDVVGRLREHYFSVLPYIRLTWLERRSVRLYSACAFGCQFGWLQDYRGRNRSEVYGAGHVTFIGITAGRRVFGYAELGVGTFGVISAGVGYRFNSK